MLPTLENAGGDGKDYQMKIFIDIPIDHYHNLLQRCGPAHPEYELLKNGVITRDREKCPAVEILCEPEDARRILDLANAIYPNIAPHLEESISLARQPQCTKASAGRQKGRMARPFAS
jgi:hypothetical protein